MSRHNKMPSGRESSALLAGNSRAACRVVLLQLRYSLPLFGAHQHLDELAVMSKTLRSSRGDRWLRSLRAEDEDDGAIRTVVFEFHPPPEEGDELALVGLCSFSWERGRPHPNIVC